MQDVVSFPIADVSICWNLSAKTIYIVRYLDQITGFGSN